LKDVGIDNIRRASFGVDPDLFRIARRRSRPKQLLYAGRLDADKEFDLVLDIIPDLLRRRDIRITIAGTGRYQRKVASISHPRFRYVGHHADRRVMRAMYALHDILLAPGRYETFGLSALEGAAAGLPVVGPSEGGTGELLSQWRSPLTFQAGDVEGFLERVFAAVDGDHGPLFERGRALARRYGSWSEAVARHVAIYESMLGAPVAEPVSRIA